MAVIGRDQFPGIRVIMLMAAALTTAFVVACNDEDDDGVGPRYHEHRDAVADPGKPRPAPRCRE